MKKVTFIHAADLHLDSPMVGLKYLPKKIFERLQQSTFASFAKIVDAAILHQVDFVILAGDLFDGEDRSLRAQTRFRKQLERLAQQHIPVFIVHGNHDHLAGKWANIAMPQNAYVFPTEFTSETIEKQDGTKISLYGFSYPKRHVTERRIDDYFRADGADFHIGLLHGHYEGNSDHGRYAPFSLADLLEKNYDYWALGHIHKRIHLTEEPPVIYPGNIQGRHQNETGEKGCYLVTLTESNSKLEFIPSADVIWENVSVDATTATSVAELQELCRNTVDQVRREAEGILLHLTLQNVALPDAEKELLVLQELVETLQDEEKEENTSFVWPYKLTIEEAHQWEREHLITEADFYAELFQAVDTYETIDECLAPLYQHTTARKFISLPSEAEKNQLIKEAEEMLVQFLKRG